MDDDKIMFKLGSRVLTIMMISIVLVNFYVLIAGFVHYIHSSRKIMESIQYSQEEQN